MLAGTNERLDFQVLLYPFEIQIYLPPCLINIRNRLGSQLEVVGQKNIVFAGFRITITGTTQLNGTFLCRLGTDEFDGLVAAQPRARQVRPASDTRDFALDLSRVKKNIPLSVN